MLLTRILLALAALLLAIPAFAVSLADRSLFYQGHWWDPNRSGNGFEIFNAAETVQVIWYTFDFVGRPIWYTAQGPVASIGAQSWPLLHHRWSNGGKEDATVVGSLRLNLKHAEAADVTWNIDVRQGTWAIQPFIVSGVVNEVDHTGSWFDPANSGWGISLTEQGDVLGGVLFTYDANGEPTWVAGFERGSTGSVAMYSAEGTCTWCPYQPTITRAAGRLSFAFRSETQLVLRSQLSLAMAPGVNADGAPLAMLSRPASWRAADRQLAGYPGDAALKTHFDTAILDIAASLDPAPVVTPSAPGVPGASFSATKRGGATCGRPTRPAPEIPPPAASGRKPRAVAGGHHARLFC